ncbi:MAG: DUF362 domain-containing protein [Phycisphaerae bacterium]|nr:DUF362 domain-containing protein [Phycisphaerae bacterium]
MSTQKRAVVSIAHTNEKHRSQERVLSVVQEALDHLGGMSRFVRPGNTVLIKPNQTVFYSAEEGCTTDPLMVGALIRLAREAGAGRVQVGESSGGFFSSMDCMRITGMAAVAEREGAELINLGSDEVPNRTVQIPQGLYIKEAPLPVPILEADVIIDTPKAKNHHIEPISGALKNWMGVLNQRWRNDHHGKPEHVRQFMDIMSARPPDLVVVDALIAGEGDGPIANLPRWCGCILASTDPVATDVTIAKLLMRDWTKLNYAIEAEKRGLGIREPIDYIGTPLEQVAFPAWPGHEGFDYLPINFLVGNGVTLDGTIGHVKSVLDSMLRRGNLRDVIWLRGTPTIMVGEIDDPNFEQHLKEGPYVVFDDAARPRYKNDPRVHFVPGHPVLRTAMPELFKGMGVSLPGSAVMELQEYQREFMHNMRYGTPARKAKTLLKPLAAVGLVVAGIVVLKSLASRTGRNGRWNEAMSGRSAAIKHYQNS